MKKYWYNILNFIAILVGAGIWVSSFYNSHLNQTLLNAVAFCGGLYVLYSIYLFFLNRVKFDWHLLKGNYIFKVLALVLYIPFVLTCCYNYIGKDNSPKTLVYEDNLYKPDTLFVPVKDKLAVEAVSPFLALHHDIDIKNDTLFVVQSELPETIQDKQVDPSLFWSIYFHFIDPGNQHMTTTPDGRLWAAIIGLLGVLLLNGLLVSAIIGWVDTRKEKWLKGEVRYKWILNFCPHYVIIGGNDIVPGIVKQLFEVIGNDRSSGKGKSIFPTYILIQTNRDVEAFRRELFTDLTEDQQKRIIIYYGSRTSAEDIAELKLEKAKEVYILGEDTRTDDLESYHDTMNMECLKLVSEDIKDVTGYYCVKDKYNNITEDYRLVCRVMFEYQSTFNILQVTDIDGEKINFLPFNYYEMWAQKVLVCQKLGAKEKYDYLPLENMEGIKSTADSFVHFVVVGMSRMGLAMAIEAAHLAHYPNFETKKKRTRITFIDSAMRQEKHFFMGRFKEMFALARYREVNAVSEDIYSSNKYSWTDPLVDENVKSPYKGNHLGTDFVDVEWEFVNGSIENPNVQQYVEDAASNPDAKLTIAVCLPENSRAIAAAAYLPDAVYSSKHTLQVLVYQRMNDELLRQINVNKRYHGKLKAFGMNKDGYDASLIELSEYIGKRLGEKYDKFKEKQDATKQKCPFYKGKEFVAKTDASSTPKNGESANDTNNEPTKEKPKSAKWWSNKYNIYTMWTKFRCMDANSESIKNENFVFGDKDLENLGKMEHNRWVVEQLLLRYRPLTAGEQENAKIDSLCSSDKEKGRLKSDEYAHLDICSNARLNQVDYNMSKLDQALIQVLPEAYREYLNKKSREKGNAGKKCCKN